MEVVSPEVIEARPNLEDSRPLLVWEESGFEGESLPIHVARIAIAEPSLEIVAVAQAATGSSNEGLALVLQPEDLARDTGLLLAINANAFQEGGALQKIMARSGRAVSLYGPAICQGQAFPGKEDPYAGTLWVRPDGTLAIATLEPGALLEMEGINNAVSGFHQLVRDGKVLDWGAPTGEDAQRIARSAAGISADGSWLYLVVAEGKTNLISETGYTEPAVARLLAELGCAEALMLDCGGSSVLLADFGKGPRLLNRPAGGGVRPVPVLLGVRLRETQ